MKIREMICMWLFKLTEEPYNKLFKRKRKPWTTKLEDLQKLNEGSWGKALHKFLSRNDFTMLPKLEKHDAYHVLLKMGTEVKDEIGMQYLLIGNGKRTPYLFATIFVGTILVPDYFPYYKSLYKKGKCLPKLYDLKVENMLNLSLRKLQRDLAIDPGINVISAPLDHQNELLNTNN